MNKQPLFVTSRQLAFKELFVGTFIYAVVLGFFNDYTQLVEAKSFSTIFLASIVLEALTYVAFLGKGRIMAWAKGRAGMVYKFLMFFCIWLIMFVSKFVFVWAIDLIFAGNITIHGFFGILLVVVSVTVVHKAADFIFIRLGKGNNQASAEKAISVL